MQRCVIVIEDEPLIRMDAVAMLEEAGLDVMEFDRADEALRFIQRHVRDVAGVFTDINLRGRMSGIELAEIIDALMPDIHVVVTSGRFERKPAGLPPAVAYMPKPWLPLQVINAMQNAVSA